MNCRPFVGSSWLGSFLASLFPPVDPPDPGDPPVDPPVDPDVTGLVNRLMTGSRTLAVWHHGEASGNAIPDLRGNFPGTITTGQVVRQQPALSVGDPSRNSTIYVNGYSTVPGDLAQARPGGGCIIVAQAMPSTRWLGLIDRFGDSWQNAGGFDITDAYIDGHYRLRGQINDGSGNVVIQPLDVELFPGTCYARALTWGPLGLRLFLGNETSQALIGSNATTAGSQGAYPIIIGADRAGASRFAGAIDLVALYDGQPDDADVLLDLAAVKAGVVWTNDGAVTLQASTTAVFDPRPTALVDSASPTAVVTVQPSNATATAQAGGTISVTAGGSAGSSTNGRFTLDGSPAAQLSVTVTPSVLSIKEMFANPLGADSEFRKPIGRSATFSSSTRLADYYSAGNTWVINAGNGYDVPTTLGAESDPQVTVTRDSGTVVSDLPLSGVYLPAGFCAGGTNEGALLVQPNGDALDLYSFNGTTAGASIGWNRSKIYGLGHGVNTGDRVGSSASGGLAGAGVLPVDILEDEEVDTDTAIQWALHLVLPRGLPNHVDNLLSRAFQLPATSTDSNAGTGSYNQGPFPYGARFSFINDFDHAAAIDAAAAAASITNASSIRMGKMVAASTYKYGLIAWDGGQRVQFRASRAFTVNQRRLDLMELCRRVLLPNMRWITNGITNATGLRVGGSLTGVPGTSGAIYGGGTPRAPNTGIAP